MRYISIHAPREGCDKASTLYTLFSSISIHAPREGCDIRSLSSMNRSESNFNPRTP